MERTRERHFSRAVAGQRDDLQRAGRSVAASSSTTRLPCRPPSALPSHGDLRAIHRSPARRLRRGIHGGARRGARGAAGGARRRDGALGGTRGGARGARVPRDARARARGRRAPRHGGDARDRVLPARPTPGSRRCSHARAPSRTSRPPASRARLGRRARRARRRDAVRRDLLRPAPRARGAGVKLVFPSYRHGMAKRTVGIDGERGGGGS